MKFPAIDGNWSSVAITGVSDSKMGAVAVGSQQSDLKLMPKRGDKISSKFGEETSLIRIFFEGKFLRYFHSLDLWDQFIPFHDDYKL